MPLAVLREPFDHPEWIFELKYDGFRSLAFVKHGTCRRKAPFQNLVGLYSRCAATGLLAFGHEGDAAVARGLVIWRLKLGELTAATTTTMHKMPSPINTPRENARNSRL